MPYSKGPVNVGYDRCVDSLHSQTLSGTFGERNNVPIEILAVFGGTHPAFGVELRGLGEECGVHVHKVVGLADRCLRNVIVSTV